MEVHVDRERKKVQQVGGDRRRQPGNVQAGQSILFLGGNLLECSTDSCLQGLFSSNKNNNYQVDKEGLRNLTVEALAQGLQSNPDNEMAGLEGRAQLLIRLGEALAEKREFFGEDGRPGNMLGTFTAKSSFPQFTNTAQTISSRILRPKPQASSSSRFPSSGTSS